MTAHPRPLTVTGGVAKARIVWMEPFLFPKWVNQLRPVFAIALVCIPAYVILVVAHAATPQTTNVGYAPIQPVAYSHALHAGELGLDCRYCHNTVESAAGAAIPPTQTCLNCHKTIRSESERLVAVRLSARTGRPIEWLRVHDLPDYVYFDHSAHVRRGVGCASCHGRVDTMDVVYQAEPLSMGWCLDCHRTPEPHLRPPGKITDMQWTRDDATAEERDLLRAYNVRPSTDCNTCHR